MKKSKPETSTAVLYEALYQAVMPLRDSVAHAFDDLYHVKPEDRVMNKKTPLSEVLEWAESVAYDYEVNKAISDVVEGLDL